MIVLGWAITVLNVAIVVTWIIYLRAAGRRSFKQRPLAPAYDRFGRFLGLAENPDYHVNPGEPGVGEVRIVEPKER